MPLRPLSNFEQIEDFLITEINFDITESNYSLVPQISSTELNLENLRANSFTFRSSHYRNKFYRNDAIRLNLRRKIVFELLSKQRLEKDDNIILGSGGALPIKRNTSTFNKETDTPYLSQGKSFIIIGLPASGKSNISDRVADEFGAIILDSDYAKRKLPEFNCLPFGATLVHDESSEIIFGKETKNKFPSLFELCTETQINLVIPKIGSSPESITPIVDTLKGKGYEVHIILVNLDKKKATQRALERFNDSKRYVPLSLIYDIYADNSLLTYNILKSENISEINSFCCISTDVPKDSDPCIIEQHNAPYPADLFQRKS